jgi:hypothetical protein
VAESILCGRLLVAVSREREVQSVSGPALVEMSVQRHVEVTAAGVARRFVLATWHLTARTKTRIRARRNNEAGRLS